MCVHTSSHYFLRYTDMLHLKCKTTRNLDRVPATPQTLLFRWVQQSARLRFPTVVVVLFVMKSVLCMLYDDVVLVHGYLDATGLIDFLFAFFVYTTTRTCGSSVSCTKNVATVVFCKAQGSFFMPLPWMTELKRIDSFIPACSSDQKNLPPIAYRHPSLLSLRTMNSIERGAI